jgi:hypothetical protein
MTKASKFDLAEMKALFAAPPVLSTESAEQFEKVFDQVAVSLNVQDSAACRTSGSASAGGCELTRA